MTSRGQSSFTALPAFAAILYTKLTQTRGIEAQQREIASDLASRLRQGRLLDVGTGPGSLLVEIHRLNPALELFGLDVSRSMVDLARKRLNGLAVEVRHCDVRNSGFPDGFFDLVTCTGSLYLWDFPVECLDEIFRILKPLRSGIFFETYKDCDHLEVRDAIKSNLKAENRILQLLAPRFFAKQLRMTYTADELGEIINHTRFAPTHSTEPIRLAGVPAWLRITVTKRG